MWKLLLNEAVLRVFSIGRWVRMRREHQREVLERAGPVWRRFLAVVLTCMGATIVLAQQAGPPPHACNSQLMQELLGEVRQLRLTCERASAASARLQIMLQRMQLQQNQMNRIGSKLDSVRDELMRAESQQAQSSSQLSDLDNRLSQEKDPNRQKELQEQQKDTRRVLEQQSRSAQDLRTTEGELTASWQREEARLNEFQERLNALEKAAEPPPTPEKSALAQ